MHLECLFFEGHLVFGKVEQLHLGLAPRSHLAKAAVEAPQVRPFPAHNPRTLPRAYLEGNEPIWRYGRYIHPTRRTTPEADLEGMKL